QDVFRDVLAARVKRGHRTEQVDVAVDGSRRYRKLWPPRVAVWRGRKWGHCAVSLYSFYRYRCLTWSAGRSLGGQVDLFRESLPLFELARDQALQPVAPLAKWTPPGFHQQGSILGG